VRKGRNRSEEIGRMMGGRRNGKKKKSLKGRIEIHVVLAFIEEDDQKEGVEKQINFVSADK